MEKSKSKKSKSWQKWVEIKNLKEKEKHLGVLDQESFIELWPDSIKVTIQGNFFLCKKMNNKN